MRSAFDEISLQLVTSFSTIAFTLANAAAARSSRRLSAIRAGQHGLFVQGLEEVPILYDKDGKSILEVGGREGCFRAGGAECAGALSLRVAGRLRG